MIIEAKRSGADAVKFQTFKAEDLVTPKTQKVEYQKSTTSPKETHYDMIKSLELSEKITLFLKIFVAKKKLILYLHLTELNLQFLNKIKCGVFKTASADIVDLEMHEYLAKKIK